MKYVLSVLLFFILSSQTSAQVNGGVAGFASYPVGNFADVADFSAGGGAIVRFQVLPILAVTACAGISNWFLNSETEGITVRELPFFAGLNYFLAPNVYGLVEAGLHRFKIEATFEEQTFSQTNNEFGFSVGAGTLFGPADVSLRFTGISDSNSARIYLAWMFGG